MRLRIAIAIFSLSVFALVLTVLFQLAGPRRNSSRWAHAATGVGLTLDSQGVEFRLSLAERKARQGERYRDPFARDRAGWGFEFATEDAGSFWPGNVPATSSFLRVPLWAVDSALGLLIAASFINFRRAARRAQRRLRNECPACGYDLRATPGRCPECGHITASVSSQT